ncbi:hypothetical protein PROVRUST_06897 [Providencia rustigianii DSM 4541]|uniref:Uncharacterized protein n=1 Tax=Providencia rustigianii DSM 4541 TaxID=500637 RepID=D1P3M6_9GAMM|nr:hypothetical protein PROVRUST_06897 [Providencia rustigianii DSM 4541]
MMLSVFFNINMGKVIFFKKIFKIYKARYYFLNILIYHLVANRLIIPLAYFYGLK